MHDDLNEIDLYLKKLNNQLTDNDENVFDEVEKVLKTIDNLSRREKYAKILRFLGIFLLITGFIVLYWEYCYIYVVDLARLIVILIKPVIDLSVFYQERCLLKNPHYIEETRVNNEMCKKTCVTNTEVILNRFDKKSFSQDLFINLVVNTDLPIIEFSEIKKNDWINDDDVITIQTISKIYLNEIKSLKEEDFCYFDSTTTKFDEKQGILKFFEFLSHHNFKSLSAKWENCQPISSKILRKLTKRPYFLPPDVEIVAQNWFFISKGQEKDYSLIPVSLRYMMFCQLVGEAKIKLKPNYPCESACPEKKFTLKAGEILIFSDMWFIEYKQMSSHENIAILLLAR